MMTRQELIDFARNPDSKHVPSWAEEIVEKIEQAPNERAAAIWTERLAGALGFEAEDI